MASISIRHNKNGSTAYVVRAYVCRDEKGKAHYLSKTYTPQPGMGKQKIEHALRELCAEMDRKAPDPNSLGAQQTFRDYAASFLQKKNLSCGEYTLHSYRIALDKACEYIGSVPLEKLCAAHLSSMYRDLSTAGCQYGTPYSGSYIRHVHTLVRMVLGQAVREGILTVNIADRSHFDPPRSERREPVFLELEEARQYIQAALQEEDMRLRCCILLFLYTGMRREELCGLEWEDIQFQACRIAIHRASVYIPGKGLITKAPKNDSSARLIQADPLVFAALQEYREWCEVRQKAAGELWRETERLFVRENGQPLLPETTAIWVRRFAKKHGLRPVTPHKLRHTYATLQIFYGTDIRTVADSLGHSTPATTLNIYSHQVRSAAEKAAEAMSAMLNPPPDIPGLH